MTSRRERLGVAVGDGLLAGALGVVGLVDALTDQLSEPNGGSVVPAVVGVVVATALLSQRRRHPELLAGVFLVWIVLVVATLGDVKAMFYGTFVPLLLATYSAARHGDPRTRVAVAVLAPVAVLLSNLLLPTMGGWSGFAFNVAVTGIAFATGLGLRRAQQRAVVDAVRAARLEREAHEAARRAVEEERARIADDLHDVLGHCMSAMVVQAGAAEQVVGVDADAVRQALEDIRLTGTGALDEVRRVVTLLREPVDVAGGSA